MTPKRAMEVSDIDLEPACEAESEESKHRAAPAYVGTISVETGEYEEECSRRKQNRPVRVPPLYRHLCTM